MVGNHRTNHCAHRPDLLVLDDLESSANTNTGELRIKNLDWFNKVVIPIGDPAKTAFVYMGTIVHIDGLLPHVLQRADFETRTYAAIIERPDHDELWNNSKKSFAIINMGTKAFNSEFMNNPIDPDSQIFNTEAFQYFDYDKLHEMKKHLDYCGAWDIALGKNNRSDFNAIIIIGRDRRTGIFYVVDAWAKKAPAHKAMEVAAEKIMQYKPKIFAVESVAAQFDLFRQLRDLLQKRSISFQKYPRSYHAPRRKNESNRFNPYLKTAPFVSCDTNDFL